MSAVKPLTLYTHPSGPNPWKVMMVLNELKVPYRTIVVAKEDLKKQSYEAINPNGRAPSIVDPNENNFTLWESGAIIEYLVDKYDSENKLGFPQGTPEFYHARQWLYFQVSGQGPYFGQASWFENFHPEKIPSAIDRYMNEIGRVSSVLDRALQGKEWLVGNRFSYADIAFVSWYDSVETKVVGDAINFQKEFPHMYNWLGRTTAQPGVAQARAAKVGVTSK